MALRALAIFVAFAGTLASATAQVSFGWTTYVNDRFGFSLRYPADVFQPERRSETGDGEVFVGMRGQGRLLVGAFENTDGHSIGSYMNFIRRESYARYDISYAPRGQGWAVLSGQDGENVFYEKVVFSCGGRIISSFALVYPIESKPRFDPIVEGIEKSFRPGQDCSRHATR